MAWTVVRIAGTPITATDGKGMTEGFQQSVAVGADSKIVLIGAGVIPTAAIPVADATGRAIEYSTSPPENILADAAAGADSTAYWRVWTKGTVTSATAAADRDDTLKGPIRGLRLNNAGGAGGAVTWEVAE